MRKFTYRKKSEGNSMYPNNPMLNQQMAQLEQEFLQRKQNLMQSFYAQNQPQNIQSQPQPVQDAQAAQNVNWVYVSGVEGAKNQIVQPGQTSWMMDNNNPYIYVKSVDKIGSPEFHAFFIQEVPESELVSHNEQTQPQIDTSQYVHRDEFEQLKAQFDKITNQQNKQSAKANKGVEDNG